jgi:uncharacterized phage protein gp47/JayE
MAEINQDGISTTSLSTYKVDIENIFKSALGDNFNIDPETAQGQIIGELALAFTQSDNSIIDMFNGTDIYSTIGIQIDYLASNLGLYRKAAVNSEAICTLTGVVGTVIPAGALAEDINGNKYSLSSDVTIPVGNSITGIFICQTAGSIVIQANTINKIVDVIQGWETINNADVGITGYAQETDPELRKRYIDSVAINSVSQLSSIKSCLAFVQDVKQVEVVQNDEDTEQVIKGLTLPAHSITTVVLGGNDTDIVECIGKKKPVGIKTHGDISGIYTDAAYYTTLPVKFYRAIEVETLIEMSIKTDLNFPSDGLDQLKNNIVAYFNGTFTVTPGYNLDGMKIGKDVIYSRLLTPINQVVGHEVTLLTIGRLGGTLAVSDININLNEIAIIDSSNINITVV